MLRKRLARNVRRLRNERGLSLEQAAGDVDMHARHWQKLEAAEIGVSLRTLDKLAVALNTEVSDLLR